MTDDDFEVAGVDVARNGELVKLIFLDRDDNTRPVVLHQHGIPQLIGALQQHIAAGKVVPMTPKSARIGAIYALEGHGIRKNPDGSAVLTLFVNLPEEGRTVTFDLPLAAKDAQALAKQLGG